MKKARTRRRITITPPTEAAMSTVLSLLFSLSSELITSEGADVVGGLCVVASGGVVGL